jgi:hypothetical protein
MDFKKKWQINIMEKVIKQMAIHRVKRNALIYQHPKTSEDEKRKAIPLAHFSRSLISDYNSQKPLSVIQLDNGKFMAALKKPKIY